jgi:hypothetical protein
MMEEKQQQRDEGVSPRDAIAFMKRGARPGLMHAPHISLLIIIIINHYLGGYGDRLLVPQVRVTGQVRRFAGWLVGWVVG